MNRIKQSDEIVVLIENAKENEIKVKVNSNKNTGFCIRTGVPIQFDIEKPLIYDAFKGVSKVTLTTLKKSVILQVNNQAERRQYYELYETFRNKH